MPRKPKKNPIILGFALLFMSIALFSLCTINRQGTFKEPEYQDLLCNPFASVAGPEHFLMTKSGQLLVSSQDRQAGIYEQSWPQGAVMLFNPGSPYTPPVNLTSGFKGEFHPRGISLFEDEKGRTLFVVNYLTGGYSIEVFSFNDAQLVHKKTIRSDMLIQPGKISARNHNSFYVMNEHGLFTASGHFIEEFLGLKASHVLFHDGTVFLKTVEDLRLGYGLFYHPGTRMLYITDMKDKKVYRYTHPDPGKEAILLTFRETSAYPADIGADRSGRNLLLTSHPQLLQSNSHMLNPRQVAAPSQIVSLDWQLEHSEKEIMLSKTSGTSAASCALIWKNSLILGGAFENHLSICKLPDSFLTDTN